MAAGDVTNRKVFPTGSIMCSVGDVEHGTSAGYTFDTGLSRVDTISICWKTTQAGPALIAYLNTNTTSDNAAGYGGKVYMAGDLGTPWGSNGETYWYEARGAA